jgi:hypothetical protein
MRKKIKDPHLTTKIHQLMIRGLRRTMINLREDPTRHLGPE